MNNLIERSQRGEPQAFAALFEQYKNLVFRAAYLMLDSRTEAEDALQEVFLQVHRSLGSYDPEKGAFTTWLHRVTVNYCLNQRRKKRFSLSALHLVPAHLVATRGRSVEEQALEGTEIRRVLDRLSDKLRVVVVLRFYADLSYAEISEALNLPLGTVQSRLNQALKILKREMGDWLVEAHPNQPPRLSEEYKR